MSRDRALKRIELRQKEAALGRILRSQYFSRARLAARLLDYCFRMTIRNQSAQLSERAIARVVFGKKNFIRPDDSSVAALVSIVRKKLRAYYDEEGREDRIVIELPKYKHSLQFKWSSAGGLGGETFHASVREVLHFLNVVVGTRELGASVQGRNLIALSEDFPHRTLTLDELRTLCTDIGAHPLLLDPLCAPQVQEPVLVGSLRESFTLSPVVRGSTESSRFYFAGKRQRGFASLLRQIALEPGATSGGTQYFGDELAIVLDGHVEVRFYESGLSARVRAGEGVHLSAQLPHSFTNLARSRSHVLVVQVLRASQGMAQRVYAAAATVGGAAPSWRAGITRTDGLYSDQPTAGPSLSETSSELCSIPAAVAFHHESFLFSGIDSHTGGLGVSGRRLASSDVSVAKVLLRRESEIVLGDKRDLILFLPFRGSAEVRVLLRHTEQHFSVSSGEYGHLGAEHPCIVCNRTARDVEALLVYRERQ